MGCFFLHAAKYDLIPYDDEAVSVCSDCDLFCRTARHPSPFRLAYPLRFAAMAAVPFVSFSARAFSFASASVICLNVPAIDDPWCSRRLADSYIAPVEQNGLGYIYKYIYIYVYIYIYLSLSVYTFLSLSFSLTLSLSVYMYIYIYIYDVGLTA